MKLGVLTCIHGDLKKARIIAKKFQREKVDAVVLAGDICADTKQAISLKKIINTFLILKKTIFMLPGSHEIVEEYKKALNAFKKNKLVYDCSTERKIRFGGCDLVFLPGSDAFVSILGAKYLIRDNLHEVNSIKRRWPQIAKAHPQFFRKTDKPMFYCINSLNKLANKKSILISHVPPKFKKQWAIDVAEFGTATKTFAIIKKHLMLNAFKEDKQHGDAIYPKNCIIPLEGAMILKRYGYPIAIQKKNVGNEYLKSVIRKLKIKKMICGHIHESGGKACDLAGNKIKYNKWSKELFYNASHSPAVYEIEGNVARVKKL